MTTTNEEVTQKETNNAFNKDQVKKSEEPKPKSANQSHFRHRNPNNRKPQPVSDGRGSVNQNKPSNPQNPSTKPNPTMPNGPNRPHGQPANRPRHQPNAPRDENQKLEARPRNQRNPNKRTMNPTSNSFVPNASGENKVSSNNNVQPVPQKKKKKESKDSYDSQLRGLRNFVEVSGIPLESTEDEIRKLFPSSTSFQLKLLSTSKKDRRFALLFNSEEDVFTFLLNYKEDIRKVIKDKKDPHQVEFVSKQPQGNIKLSFSETRLTPLVDITDEYMAKLPLGGFTGKVTVIESNLMGEVDSAVESILGGKELNQINPGEITLGVDLEWKPNFQKGENSLASLLQIGTTKEVFLFRLTALVIEKLEWQESFKYKYTYSSAQIFAMGGRPPFQLPSSLVSLLSSNSVYKVGVGISHQDTVKLEEDYGIKMGGVHDISNFPILKRFTKTGLKPLTSYYLGVTQPKRSRLTNWELKVLSNDQLKYAANDAYFGLLVWNKLKEIEHKTFLAVLLENNKK
eukprot:TRINITY_DN5587_c0_g1_i1.p1 TRINITY_DN5587_c0_g1~~TRINITY_DN5587_c0_g1_i1.p1  ORF type:complete len:522 (+),score=153.78 TRINITY_DN5587_c0_g1_i1:29-1567(+)